MASNRSLGGGIKIPQGGGAIPNYGGSNNALMNMIAAQSMLPKKKEIESSAELGQQQSQRGIQDSFLNRPETGKSVVVGAKDPSGIELKTQAGQNYEMQLHMRKKASEDVVRLKGMRAFIDDLHKNYELAFDEDAKKATGLAGKYEATKELAGMMFGQNRYLRNYIDNLKASGAALGKFGGDTGNFTTQEQMNAIGRLGVATLNADPTRLFTPDAYLTGKAKFEDLYDLYDQRISEAAHVAETGDITGTNYEKKMAPPDGNDLRSRYNALRAQGMSAEEAKARLAL